MSGSTTADERLVSGYTGRMLLVTTFGWAALQASRFVIPPLLPEIRADIGLSLGEAGVALAVLTGVYSVFQYPSGRLSDSWNPTTVIVPALGVLALGCLLIGSANSYWLLVAGAATFGVGKGLYAIPSRALLSDLFVEHRGRALGLYGAGSDFGGAVASGLAVVVLAVATWRAPFLPLAALLVGLAVLFAVWTRESYVVRRADLGILDTTRRLLATPSQRWTLLAYMLFYFMVNGILNFLPGYLREVKGFSPELASTGFALLFVLGIGIKPVAGAFSDHFPRRLVSTAALVISAAAIGLLLVVESVVAIVVAIVVLAVGYKGQLPVVDAILLDSAPDDSVGGDLGAARTLFLGSGSLGPAFVGITADLYGYSIAFVLLGVAALAGAAILFWQGRVQGS